jgi:hypothetical protein
LLDGLLVATKWPTKKETSKVTSYFLGHKKQNGLNCQAFCYLLTCASCLYPSCALGRHMI